MMRHQPRGFSLIELIVGQVIVGIIAAGVFSLIAAQTQSFHSTWATTEAQVRLREATHLMLRDVQGLGDVDDSAGEVIGFLDGGATAADTLMAYRADIALCSDNLAGTYTHATEEVFLENVSGSCPIDNLPGCTSAEVMGRTAMIHGPGGTAGSGFFIVTAVNAGTCTFNVASGSNANHLLIFDAIHDTIGTATTADALQLIQPTDGASVGVSFGTSMRFVVDATQENLVRQVNGQPPTTVVEGVRDLQVQTAHDLDGDGAISGGEWDQTGGLVGGTLANFVAAKIGLMAFASSKKSFEVPPPNAFGNRTHSGAPTGRRYRQSFVVAAGRN